MEELIQLMPMDLVIFHELTPRQNQLLSEALAVRVIDRVQLIWISLLCVRAPKKESYKLN